MRKGEEFASESCSVFLHVCRFVPGADSIFHISFYSRPENAFQYCPQITALSIANLEIMCYTNALYEPEVKLRSPHPQCSTKTIEMKTCNKERSSAKDALGETRCCATR